MQILSGRKGTSCCMTGCLSTESTDHIGILLKLEKEKLVVAEGNVGDTNCSGVVRREKDEHIRAIIRIPDGFIYE